MTAKRFKKRLMAVGISRNDAVAYAKERPKDKSYSEYFRLIFSGIAFKVMGISAKKATMEMARLSVTITKAFAINDPIEISVTVEGSDDNEQNT